MGEEITEISTRQNLQGTVTITVETSNHAEIFNTVLSEFKSLGIGVRKATFKEKGSGIGEWVLEVYS